MGVTYYYHNLLIPKLYILLIQFLWSLPRLVRHLGFALESKYPSKYLDCGRLAGVWLASVNEAVFGVIIFLLSSYYLIIILLSGVMASIHHTSSQYSHCSHCSQGPPSSCRLMAQLTRMRSCAIKRTPGNLWSLWFHPSQEMWPDLIYSSGHGEAGSLENCTSRTHSQTKLQLME